MYCIKCGAEISDDAMFCRICGTQVASQVVSQVESPSPKKAKKTKAVIGAVVAVIVIVAAVGIGMWWKADQDAKAEWERVHAPQSIAIQIEAPGFDEQATAIPVQISGVDLDGNQVEEVRFLHPQDVELQVVQGSYDFTFPGGYFAGDGTVVKAPGTTQHVELWIEDSRNGSSGASTSSASVAASDSAASDSDVASSASADSAASDSDVASSASADSASSDSASADSASVQSSQEPVALEPIVFTPVPDLEVTEELINDIKDWASKDTDNAAKADDLSNKATEKHNKAVAEEEARKAEEEARRAEQEAARRTAAEAFCVYYTGNQTVIDASSGKTEPVVNGKALALQFVEPGTSLYSQIQGAMEDGQGNLMISAAVAIHDSTAISVDGDTVVVQVTYSASQGNRSNWLMDSDTILVYCTFADDNLIVDAEKDGNTHLTGSVG